jgi:hypothetical protein
VRNEITLEMELRRIPFIEWKKNSGKIVLNIYQGGHDG